MRCSVCGRTFILSSFSRSSAGRISLESIFFGVSSTGLAAGQGGGNQLTAPTLDHRLIIRTERLIERTGSLIKGRRTTPANRLNKFPVNWARLSHTTDRGSGGPFHRLGPPPVLAVIYLTAPPPPTPNPTLGWTSAYVSYELWPIITRCPPSGFARVERVLLVTPLPLI